MVNVSTLSEQIEGQLKDDISSGKLVPGQRLSIAALAKRWGVSSMPVRDAIRRLETVGFVEVIPRVGVFVTELNQKRFKNIMDIRIGLECLAIELAAERIPGEEIDAAIASYRTGGAELEKTGDTFALQACDNLVHSLIVQHCDNPELIGIMDDLKALIDWAHQASALYQADSFQIALPEHLRILDALQARDMDRAKDEMRAHLQKTCQRTLAAWGPLETETADPAQNLTVPSGGDLSI